MLAQSRHPRHHRRHPGEGHERRDVEFSNDQRWPYVSGAAKFWRGRQLGLRFGAEAPTIAIVDSGVDAGRADFGGRVLTQVWMSSLLPNSPTTAAGTARSSRASPPAGQSLRRRGPERRDRLARRHRRHGMAMTSDVIAAADWILQNKAQYGIRVANFSLHGSQPSTFRFDPLNRAVERLWFSGVVVVAAAGNYGDNQSGVIYSPGNDPFVITVGAVDIGGTTTSTTTSRRPGRPTATRSTASPSPSSARPAATWSVRSPRARRCRRAPRPHRRARLHADVGHVVRGAGRGRRGRLHPRRASQLDAGPGQGRADADGAPYTRAVPVSAGVGEIDAAAAADVDNPPNPNRPERVRAPRPGRRPMPVFDQATWTTRRRRTRPGTRRRGRPRPGRPATWTSATWVSATWTSATWTTATWTRPTSTRPGRRRGDRGEHGRRRVDHPDELEAEEGARPED